MPSEVINEGSIYSECLLRDISEGKFSLHEKFPALCLGISQVAIVAQTQNISVQANKELHLNCSSFLYQRVCVRVCCRKLDYWTRVVCWAVARWHTKLQTGRGFSGLVCPKVPSSVNWNLKTFDRRCGMRCSSLSRGRYFRGKVGGPLLPSVNPACQVPPLITTLAPPLALSILAFPSVLFFPVIHECLACSVHSNQHPNPSGIHYMRTSRAVSNSFFFSFTIFSTLSGERGYPMLLCSVSKWCYTDCHYQSAHESHNAVT